MREFFPIAFSSVAIVLVGSIEIGLLYLLNRPWWRRRWIRTASWGLPLFGIIMVMLWGVAIYHSLDWLATVTALAAVLTFVLEVALMVSLPLSGLIHLIDWITHTLRRGSKAADTPEIDSNRRLFLKTAAAAVPVATVSLSVTGVGRAFSPARVYQIPLLFAGPPEAPDGLRLLHLSDPHLGLYVRLDNLAEVLERARDFAPELVLVTGDIADDLRLLDKALNMINGLDPRYGCFACLGNHEHYRGVAAVRRIMDSSPVRLLVNDLYSLSVNGRPIILGGVDDPRYMGRSTSAFYESALDQMLGGRRLDAFSILMCHRPDGFPAAAARGFNLVLSGHTHGTQLGWNGRSLFEYAWPEHYLWGQYRHDHCQLYTTSGMGHWFPFRLGCPTEVPVLEIRSA